MIEAIARNEKNKNYFTRWLNRPGCIPCDRAEAGHQLSRLNRELESLNDKLSLLNS
ncbi:MAG: hypothetical protein J6C44_10040 [Muribaculaceae bacterium]|nr:hypothetical protein [Muribaculaceae bacterium]